MNRREVATVIVELRRLAVAKIIADLLGEPTNRMESVFVALALTLPNSIQAGNGLNLRVVLPTYRKIKREGILAQNVRPK